MIYITRLDHNTMVVNAELIATVESTPDTMLTLSNGHQFLVRETVAEVVARVLEYRRQINGALRVVSAPPDSGRQERHSRWTSQHTRRRYRNRRDSSRPTAGRWTCRIHRSGHGCTHRLWRHHWRRGGQLSPEGLRARIETGRDGLAGQEERPGADRAPDRGAGGCRAAGWRAGAGTTPTGYSRRLPQAGRGLYRRRSGRGRDP